MTHWKTPWCWERLRARWEGGDRGWDSWMASLTRWTWVWANWETVKDREAWCAAVHGVAQSRLWPSNWTTVWWLESNLLLSCKGIWYLYSRGIQLYKVLLLCLRILVLGLCCLQKRNWTLFFHCLFEESQHTWSPPTKIKYDKYIEQKMYHLKCWRISHSVVSNSVTPWTIAHKAPLSMGYSRQEYWSGLPFPSPGYLLDPVIEPGSPHCRHSLLSYVLIIMYKHHHHPSPELILWNWNAIPFKQWHSTSPPRGHATTTQLSVSIKLAYSKYLI